MHNVCLSVVILTNFLIFLIPCQILSSPSKVPSAQVVSNGTKTVEKEASGGELKVGRIPEGVSGPSSVVADDNVETKDQEQILTLQHAEYSEDRVIRVKYVFLF